MIGSLWDLKQERTSAISLLFSIMIGSLWDLKPGFKMDELMDIGTIMIGSLWDLKQRYTQPSARVHKKLS